MIGLSGRGDKDVFTPPTRLGRTTMSRIAAARFARTCSAPEPRRASFRSSPRAIPTRKPRSRFWRSCPKAGADLIELGMPFSDPMADGPAIQASSPARAEGRHDAAGHARAGASAFAQDDTKTPIVLMGYFNPIHAYGAERFAARCGAGRRRRAHHRRSAAGGRRRAARPRGEGGHRHRAPCHARPRTMRGSPPCWMAPAAFSIMSRSPASPAPRRFAEDDVSRALARIRRAPPSFPCAVGFGIRTPEQAAAIARIRRCRRRRLGHRQRVSPTRGSAKIAPAQACRGCVKLLPSLANAVARERGHEAPPCVLEMTP